MYIYIYNLVLHFVKSNTSVISEAFCPPLHFRGVVWPREIQYSKHATSRGECATLTRKQHTYKALGEYKCSACQHVQVRWRFNLRIAIQFDPGIVQKQSKAKQTIQQEAPGYLLPAEMLKRPRYENDV